MNPEDLVNAKLKEAKKIIAEYLKVLNNDCI